METLKPEDIVWVGGAGLPELQDRRDATHLEHEPPRGNRRDVETPRSKPYP